jgi:hypothetical protein
MGDDIRFLPGPPPFRDSRLAATLWRDRELRADAFVTFSLNPDGSIDQVKMAPASPAVDFSFDFQDLLLRPVKASGRGAAPQ